MEPVTEPTRSAWRPYAVIAGAVVLILGTVLGVVLGTSQGQSKACAVAESWWHSKGAPAVGTFTNDIGAMNNLGPDYWSAGYEVLARDAQNAPAFPWKQAGYDGPAGKFGESWTVFIQDTMTGAQSSDMAMLTQASSELGKIQSAARDCGFSTGQ